jgi:hypothetical protein
MTSAFCDGRHSQRHAGSVVTGADTTELARLSYGKYVGGRGVDSGWAEEDGRRRSVLAYMLGGPEVRWCWLGGEQPCLFSPAGGNVLAARSQTHRYLEEEPELPKSVACSESGSSDQRNEPRV